MNHKPTLNINDHQIITLFTKLDLFCTNKNDFSSPLTTELPLYAQLLTEYVKYVLISFYVGSHILGNSDKTYPYCPIFIQ